MHWQFRKGLQSMEVYGKTTPLKGEIERGNSSVLASCIRQTQLIMNDANQKIVSKVLSLRFVRDIMIFGHQDVVKQVQKLIPTLTKVCSHQHNSSDPNRGESFFHDHPAYLKAVNQDEKSQINTLGSTYLILALQSIYHWSQWIPFDSTGVESIYSKAYKTLLERGVVFPSAFHYYKHSDTEKFKNTYKMQFFTDSFVSAASQPHLPQQPIGIQINHNTNQINTNQFNTNQFLNAQTVTQTYTLKSNAVQPPPSSQSLQEVTKFQSIQQIFQYLRECKRKPMPLHYNVNNFNEIAKKLQVMRQHQYSSSKPLGKNAREEKKWIDDYLVNHGLFINDVIDYNQFLHRCLSEEIPLPIEDYRETITVEDVNKYPKTQDIKLNVKNSGSGLNSGLNLKSHPSSGVKGSPKNESRVDNPDELLKKQSMQYKTKMSAVQLQLQEKNAQLNQVKDKYEEERRGIIQEYEKRIFIIKNEKKKSEIAMHEGQLQKENQFLKAKLKKLQEEISINAANYNIKRQKELQHQRNQLYTQVQRLTMENQKYQQNQLQKTSKKAQQLPPSNQLSQKELQITNLKAQLKRMQKQYKNAYDESILFKGQLMAQRVKYDQRIAVLERNMGNLEGQNRGLKQKISSLKKTIDLKDLDCINMKEELRKSRNKPEDNKKSLAVMLQNPIPAKLNSPLHLHSPPPNLPPTPKYNNYDDLYSQLKPINKELFLRLCRSSLKRKEILFKQAQLQIGIITQKISQNKLRFLLHFTNTSDKQIDNIRIQWQLPPSYDHNTIHYEVDNKYIFCIQPQQQQKISVVLTNRESPFIKERAIIQVNYQKNAVRYSHNLFLPFIITKFFDYYQVNQLRLRENEKSKHEAVRLGYSKKMLPKPSYIVHYFQVAQQTAPNKYQFEAHHRQTDLSLKVSFSFIPQQQAVLIDIISYKQISNEKQQYILEEFISFLQVAFRK